MNLRDIGKLGVLLALIVWPNVAAAADDPDDGSDIEAICNERACRTGGYDAAVFVDAHHYMSIPVSRSPYILDDGSILLFPGETIAVQFSMSGDALGEPVAAEPYAAHHPLLIVMSGGNPGPNPDDTALPVAKGKLPADDVADLPPNSLLISYGQSEQTGASGMALTLESNLLQTIKLDAVVAEVASDTYKQHYASTCPVVPKIADFESFPKALGPLVLKNFRFHPDSQSLACK